MNINAVATPEFDIQAAVAKLPKTAYRLMAAAGVAVPTGKLTVAEVDAKLADSRLTLDQRIELKVSLDRAGLLA
jgi:hypothetical protein